MTSRQLKIYLKKNNMSQGDLCRLIYSQDTANERNIVSRWINGPTNPPRFLKNFLTMNDELKLLKKTD